MFWQDPPYLHMQRSAWRGDATTGAATGTVHAQPAEACPCLRGATMSRLSKSLLAVAVVVGAVVALLAWWTGGASPALVDIDDAMAAVQSPTRTSTVPDDTTSGGASTAPAAAARRATPTGPAATTSNGTPATSTRSATPPSDPVPTAPAREWTVSSDVVDYDFEASRGTFVGFRIEEELMGQGQSTALGRTPAVTGHLVQRGQVISEAEFTADLSRIRADRTQREDAIQHALGTQTHPNATFVLDVPVELATLPPLGEAISTRARGRLTINGVTRDMTIPLRAALVDSDSLVVSTSFDVRLASHDIEVPSAPLVSGVADVATVEVQLYLVLTSK